MKRGPKPFTSKKCPACGLIKARSEFYKKALTVSHRCKPCTLAENRKRAPKYFGNYSTYRNAWRRARYKSDPEYRAKFSFSQQMYRSAVKRATPRWVDREQLSKIYREKPPGMEVDHIVPLNGIVDGRRVSGLHVPWNLQYLSEKENGKKRNKISEDEAIRNQR